MGTHCSSELYRGHILKSKINMMKLFLLTALTAVAFAEPEAEPGYYGYGYFGYPYGFGYRAFGSGIARHPGTATFFTYRSPQGLRGKRSADAEPEAEADAEPGYYGYPYYGFARYGYGYGLPGRSFAHFGGHFLGKRSAEAEPAYYGSFGCNYGSYGYPYGSYRHRAFGPGIARHPSGTSFTYRSVQG